MLALGYNNYVAQGTINPCHLQAAVFTLNALNLALRDQLLCVTMYKQLCRFQQPHAGAGLQLSHCTRYSQP